jgi:hypothetical protein
MRLQTNSSTENFILNSGLSFVKEQNGENFAFGMQGDPEAIHGLYLFLFNSGATNGELLDNGSTTFAYVWLKAEHFAYALASWEISMLASAGKVSKCDKVTGARRFYALNSKWLRWFGHIPRESFVPEYGLPMAAYGQGVTEGRTIDNARELNLC